MADEAFLVAYTSQERANFAPERNGALGAPAHCNCDRIVASVAEFPRTSALTLPSWEGPREKVKQGGLHAMRFLRNGSNYSGFLGDRFHGHCSAGRFPPASNNCRSRQQSRSRVGQTFSH